MAKSGVRLDKRKLERIIRDSPGMLSDALREEALEIVSDVVLSFGTSVSKPGDPPGVDTGALRASMHMEAKGRFEFWILDGVIYGYPLEVGTSKMAARPFMRPAFERAKKRFANRFKGLL